MMRPAAVLLLAALAPGCARSDPRPPVILIGADGLEWSVAHTLLQQGRMPNLRRLLDEGVGGKLATMVPTASPALWTTIITGREPAAHGIPFFSEVDEQGNPKDGGLPYTSECRRVPALWNLADAAGRSVTSVGWWVSWPAEPLRHGRVVASYAAQAQGALLWKAGVWTGGLPELTWPESLAERISARLQAGGPDGEVVGGLIARYGVYPPARIANKGERDRVQIRQRSLFSSAASDRTHQQIFCDLLDEEVSDLNLVYFGAPDVAGHLFWKYHEPQAFTYPIEQDQIDFFAPFIPKCYEDIDAWIGEILARLPEERIVILMADHGMRAYFAGFPERLQTGHHQDGEPGIFVLSGAGVERRGLLPQDAETVGDIRAVAPLLCNLLGIPALQEMQPNVLRGLMTAAWQAENPEPARPPSPPFRAALPPREPTADASKIFIEQFTQLGYTGVGGAAPAPPQPPAAPAAPGEKPQ